MVVGLVGNRRGYLSDQTRVFCLGEPGKPLAGAFEVASRLCQVALDAAGRIPFAGQCLGDAQKVTCVGHGHGLGPDEAPFPARGFDPPLEEGMIFVLEREFVFSGCGVVGVEDTFRVASQGLERLTPSPQELRVV